MLLLNQMEVIMNYKDRIEIIKLTILLNLILGFYNVYLFAYSNSLFNLIIGSLNIGVWVFFRDLKLVSIILNKSRNN